MAEFHLVDVIFLGSSGTGFVGTGGADSALLTRDNTIALLPKQPHYHLQPARLLVAYSAACSTHYDHVSRLPCSGQLPDCLS